MQKSSGKVVARPPATALAVLSLGICACNPAAETLTGQPVDESGAAGGCGDTGTFRARVYGEITADLDWSHEQYECRGMPRPDGNGARLFFAGPQRDESRRLAFIIAIPEFEREAAGQELASTLTLIEEGSGRFFSTSSDANCLTEITAVTAAGSETDALTVTGAVYCVSPLAEVNGDSSVSISELRFTGLLDWNAS